MPVPVPLLRRRRRHLAIGATVVAVIATVLTAAPLAGGDTDRRSRDSRRGSQRVEVLGEQVTRTAPVPVAITASSSTTFTTTTRRTRPPAVAIPVTTARPGSPRRARRRSPISPRIRRRVSPISAPTAPRSATSASRASTQPGMCRGHGVRAHRVPRPVRLHERGPQTAWRRSAGAPGSICTVRAPTQSAPPARRTAERTASGPADPAAWIRRTRVGHAWPTSGQEVRGGPVRLVPDGPQRLATSKVAGSRCAGLRCTIRRGHDRRAAPRRRRADPGAQEQLDQQPGRRGSRCRGRRPRPARPLGRASDDDPASGSAIARIVDSSRRTQDQFS